jgi:pyruvate dehydrogenase E1 component alpha subunit
MLTIRKFEEKVSELYYQKKIKGFCHLYTGQESCVVGVTTALNKNDKYITSYRDHAHPISLGTDPKYVMSELFGKESGISNGRGGSMHIFDKKKNFFGGHAIVGGQIPIGIGIAFAEKYKKSKNICITFLGDGAVRQGSFHESLNLAALYKLPIIFIIENNKYAMGTSVERSSNTTKLYKMGLTYNMISKSINTENIEDVHNTIKKLSKKVRDEGSPVLIEFKTYRYKGHSMSDPENYRKKEEVKKYKKKDPIEIIKKKIIEKNILNKEKIKEINKKVKDKILKCVEFANESKYPKKEDIYKNVYSKEYSFLKF